MSSKILVIDNYDSFTYNLYHYVEMCEVDVHVKRNDEIILSEVINYDKVILSPGPGLPHQTPMMNAVLANYSKPLLGVCLGMQGIATFYGGNLRNQDSVKHGVQTTIQVDNASKLYKNIPSKFQVGLYHSWCVEKKTLPLELKTTGISAENVIMSIEHTSKPIFGVQYHPESILSEHGLSIINNFLSVH